MATEGALGHDTPPAWPATVLPSLRPATAHGVSPRLRFDIAQQSAFTQ
jgi:hypothetical protein